MLHALRLEKLVQLGIDLHQGLNLLHIVVPAAQVFVVFRQLGPVGSAYLEELAEEAEVDPGHLIRGHVLLGRQLGVKTLEKLLLQLMPV